LIFFFFSHNFGVAQKVPTAKVKRDGFATW